MAKNNVHAILMELSPYGCVLFDLVEKQKLSSKELIDVIYSEKPLPASLLDILNSINKEILEKKLEKQYTKKICLESFLERHKNRYSHLQTIRDIALTKELANEIIKEKAYREALRLFYLKKVLLTDEWYMDYDIEIMMEALSKLQEKCDDALMKNINQHYITTITE